MKRKKLKLFLIVAMLSLPAVNTPAQNEPMKFDGLIAEGRTAPKTAFAAADAFGVYAYKNAAAWGSTFPFNSSMFMYNIPVTKQPSGSWTYSAIKYWEPGKKISFFAYYPYNASITATGSNGGTAGAPVITYNNPTVATSQSDLMYAVSLKDQNRDGATNPALVYMQFKHAMAQVKFSVMLSLIGLLPEAIKITSITIDGIVSKGDLNLDTGAWTLSSETDTFSAGIKSNFIGSGLIYTTITAPGGELMMIPQSVAGKKITITYSILGGVTNATITKTLSGSWVANNVYNYQLLLNIL